MADLSKMVRGANEGQALRGRKVMKPVNWSALGGKRRGNNSVNRPRWHRYEGKHSQGCLCRGASVQCLSYAAQ